MRKGQKVPPELKKILSLAHKGQKPWNTGIKYTDWQKRNHYGHAGRKGIPLSEEHKRKIGLANKGKPSWHIGRKRSPETCRRISDALKGKPSHPQTEATRGKIRKARMLQKFPFKDSKPERIVQSFLHLNGIEFRKHEPILGQPDIFIEPNICIFVDGCYWHGCITCTRDKDWFGEVCQKGLIRNTFVDEKLIDMGYVVKRIWEHDIYSQDELLKLLC